MTKKQLIDSLVNEISELKPAKAGYHYLAEYSSAYGGYRLVLVNKSNGGHSGCFGGNGCEARMTYKFFVNKLRTIIATLSD